MEALRALLDGNILDYLLKQPSALTRLRLARDRGAVVLLATYVLRDELNAMTHDIENTEKAEKWAQLEAIRGVLGFETVPTTGLVLGVSRLGEATLLDKDAVEAFGRLSVENPKHAEDALLALTASTHRAVLVTEDVEFRKRAISEGIEALSAAEFIRLLPPA